MKVMTKPTEGTWSPDGSKAPRRLAVIGPILGALLVGVTGFWVGANAAVAESPWYRFASEGSGAGRRCAAHMARVVTPPYEPAGYGYTRYRQNSECSSPATAPAGYLGVSMWVARQDGTICGSRDWTYNASSTNEHGAGAVANCSYNSIRSTALGRMYEKSTGFYATASSYATSPYLN